MFDPVFLALTSTPSSAPSGAFTEPSRMVAAVAGVSETMAMRAAAPASACGTLRMNDPPHGRRVNPAVRTQSSGRGRHASMGWQANFTGRALLHLEAIG